LWSGRRPRSIGGTRNIQLGIRRGGLPIELQIDALIYFFKSDDALTNLSKKRKEFHQNKKQLPLGRGKQF